MILLLVACHGPETDDSVSSCVPGAVPESYVVTRTPNPDPPEAGADTDWTVSFTDQDGCPIQDLQVSHDRMFHQILISEDLSSFQHIHPEDFGDITVDQIKAATWTLSVTLGTKS